MALRNAVSTLLGLHESGSSPLTLATEEMETMSVSQLWHQPLADLLEYQQALIAQNGGRQHGGDQNLARMISLVGHVIRGRVIG